MLFRQKNGLQMATAKAGFSTATAYRIEADPRLAWNKRLRGALATRDGCSMVDERGRATGEAEGAGCGALPSTNKKRRGRRQAIVGLR